MSQTSSISSFIIVKEIKFCTAFFLAENSNMGHTKCPCWAEPASSSHFEDDYEIFLQYLACKKNFQIGHNIVIEKSPPLLHKF